MRIRLSRFAYTEFGTLGRLTVDDDNVFYTIEKPWLNNEPFQSCIPQGHYPCMRYSSAKYPDTFEVCNVPDRSQILFHVANWSDDVQGCIGLGLRMMSERYGVAHSRSAMQRFMQLMRDQDYFELIVAQYKPVYP